MCEHHEQAREKFCLCDICMNERTRIQTALCEASVDRTAALREQVKVLELKASSIHKDKNGRDDDLARYHASVALARDKAECQVDELRIANKKLADEVKAGRAELEAMREKRRRYKDSRDLWREKYYCEREERGSGSFETLRPESGRIDMSQHEAGFLERDIVEPDPRGWDAFVERVTATEDLARSNKCRLDIVEKRLDRSENKASIKL